jgi:hypothetical protein
MLVMVLEVQEILQAHLHHKEIMVDLEQINLLIMVVEEVEALVQLAQTEQVQEVVMVVMV